MSRVLIVEPFDDFRNLLVDLCEQSEMLEVRALRALDEANDVNQWSPVVALVATELLSHGGASALRASMPSLKHVVGMATDPHTSSDLQCNHIFVKPFDAEALLRHIEQHVGYADN